MALQPERVLKDDDRDIPVGSWVTAYHTTCPLYENTQL